MDAARSTTCTGMSVTSALSPSGAGAGTGFFLVLAMKAPPFLECDMVRLPGERSGEMPNLIGVHEATVPKPTRSSPAPDCLSGTQAPGEKRRHGQHTS